MRYTKLFEVMQERERLHGLAGISDEEGMRVADLDYGRIQLFPGNYDEYLIAATAVHECAADKTKKKAKRAELQAFVSRFSANASKPRHATSRARELQKIQLEELKPSSGTSPFIRFELEKPLRRWLLQEIEPDAGEVNWAENARTRCFAQVHAAEFEQNMSRFDWTTQWLPPGADEQLFRGMLFSRDDSEKSVQVISGGEEGRLLLGKLILQPPNVLVMDDPTNHLDMESIEALNLALENYASRLVFISYYREFVSSLALRVIELTPTGVNDFGDSYEDYLRLQGATAQVA